jgi:Polyketide cyclase / dehydrase and lipid transport
MHLARLMNWGWRGVVYAGMLLLGSTALAEERWETALEGPITVRTRDVVGSPVKEVWAETEFAATVADVQAALTEPERFPSFMPHLKEAQTLSRKGNVTHVYSYLELPLVGGRDYVAETTLVEGVAEDGSGRFHQRWQAVDGVRPERPHTVRIRINEGSWQVTPRPGGRCRVVYRFRTDPGGWVPGFIAQIATTKAVPDTLRAVEHEAQRRAEARLASRTLSQGGGASPGTLSRETVARESSATPVR